jgi:hypothetical protein
MWCRLEQQYKVLEPHLTVCRDIHIAFFCSSRNDSDDLLRKGDLDREKRWFELVLQCTACMSVAGCIRMYIYPVISEVRSEVVKRVDVASYRKGP